MVFLFQQAELGLAPAKVAKGDVLSEQVKKLGLHVNDFFLMKSAASNKYEVAQVREIYNDKNGAMHMKITCVEGGYDGLDVSSKNMQGMGIAQKLSQGQKIRISYQGGFTEHVGSGYKTRRINQKEPIVAKISSVSFDYNHDSGPPAEFVLGVEAIHKKAGDPAIVWIMGNRSSILSVEPLGIKAPGKK